VSGRGSVYDELTPKNDFSCEQFMAPQPKFSGEIIAVIGVASAVKYSFCFKRLANEAKGSIQCRIDPFASFVLQAVDNCNNNYYKIT